MAARKLERQIQALRYEGTRESRREASRERVEKALGELFGFGSDDKTQKGQGKPSVQYKGFKVKLDKSKLPLSRKAVSALNKHGDEVYDDLEALEKALDQAMEEAQNAGPEAKQAIGQLRAFVAKAVDALDDAIHVGTSIGNMLR